MKKVTLITISLVVLACLAMAQDGQKGQKGQRQGGGNGIVQIIGRADVQAELKLSSDQKEKNTALIPKRGQGGGQQGQGANSGQGGNKGRGGQGDTNGAKQADLEPKIMAILDDSQEKRLEELVIQRSGNRAVFNQKVAGQLNLTREQKDKISDLRTKQRDARSKDSSNNEGNREEARAAREKANAVLDSEIGKILTESQKAKLKELGGKPFKFSAA